MFNEKRSELLRLSVILAVVALTIGVVFVLSADSSTPAKGTPDTVNASANHTINFSVIGRSTTDQRVDITKPASVSAIDCAPFIPSGWTCSDTDAAFVSFTNADPGLTEGTTVNFSVAAVSGADSGNQTFTIDTYENTAGTVNRTTLKSNVTVDADAPRILTVNVTNGTTVVLNSTTLANGSLYVRLANLTINATIQDDGGAGINAVAVYFNATNGTLTHPTDNGVALVASNGNPNNPGTEVHFNATIPASSLSHGSNLTFIIVANDTVQNTNVSNTTASSGLFDDDLRALYNVTVDGDAPTVTSVDLDNTSTVFGYNVTPSNRTLNITADVSDSGSGVSEVYVVESDNNVRTPLNVSVDSNIYYITRSLQNLGANTGDHKLQLTFHVIDLVGNANVSTTIDVEVDDHAPTFPGIATNLTANGVHLDNVTNSNSTQINVTLSISNNLNTSHNVSIHGPNDVKFNLTHDAVTVIVATENAVINGTSSWFTVNLNNTVPDPSNHSQFSFSNLSQYGCNVGDGLVCQLSINATDVFGRVNSTNISITLDTIHPAVVNASLNMTSDSVQVVRSGSILNFSAEAYNNILNVTVHGSADDEQLTNATNLTVHANGNFSVALAADLVCGGGGSQGSCTVNFTAQDTAGNINRSIPSPSITFLVDSIAPAVSNFKIAGADSYLNQTGSGGSLTLRSDLVVNITFNVTDEVTNVTQVNLGNATLRNASSHTPDGYYNITNLSDLGCPSGVEFECSIFVHASDNESIDSLRNSNSSANFTVTIDDLAPRADNFSTDLQVSHVVTSVDAQIRFSVNITDANLPAFNASIANSTSKQMNKTGTSTNTSAATFDVVASVSELGCSLDPSGSCIVTVVANDSAGNVNDSITLSVQVNNATFEIVNWTTTESATFISSKPTVHVNTSAAAQCRYDKNVGQYAAMANQFDVQGTTTTNSFTLADDTLDGGKSYHVACVDVNGANESREDIGFTIDTTSLWNVTIGKNGYNAGTGSGSYFTESNKFYTFSMDNTILLSDAPYLSGTTVNVTNVLDSLVSVNPSGSDNNLTILYALNSTDGTVTSFVPGRASGNTLNNFTADGLTYYVNLSNANERVEVT